MIPAENLSRWLSWSPRIHKVLGPIHPHTLAARESIARWTGEAGNAGEAVRLLPRTPAGPGARIRAR